MTPRLDVDFEDLDLDHEILDVCRSAVLSGLITDEDGETLDIEYFDFNVRTLSTQQLEAFLQQIWDTI